MANIKKSFNFRNGVQVDDDNFIVNPNGLVGIGTSIPREFLDVHGTAKITGLVTSRNLAVTGVSTFYSDVKIGSGVALYASTGIISATAFYGDGSNLLNVEQVAVDGWIVNAGNISTTSKVGIGTTLPSSQLDVVGGVTVSGIVTASGFGGYQVLVGTESSATKNFKVTVTSKTSNHRYTGSGSANAYFIDGIESPFLTLLPGKTYYFDQSDDSNVGNRLRFYLEADGATPYNTNVTTSPEVPGTPNSRTEIEVTDTTPVVLHYQSSSNAYMGNAAQFNSNIVNTPYQITTLAGISATTGVVTAYSFSGFGTNIQGINATNITNGTLNNSRLPQSINITGIITASSGIITSLTSTNLNNTGFATLGITSISNLTVGSAVTITFAGIFAPTGIITAPIFVGGLVGIASTARDLTSNARVNITDIQSQTSSIGVSTVSTRLYAESIGVGTDFPLSNIHIRRPGTSRLQVTSDTAEAIIAVGRSTTLNQNNGALIFGNTSGVYPYSNSKTLDVVNYDTGNVNYYLDYGSAGIGTGNFNWIYGQNPSSPLMSLTYNGNLGIGITDPPSKLYVVGTSYITGITTIDNDLRVNNDLYTTGNITFNGSLIGNLGITTLSRLGISTSTLSDNSYEFFVGGDPEFGEGVSITKSSIRASGNIRSTTITSTNINNTSIITSPSFVGALTGNVIGDVTGNLTGTATTAIRALSLSGTPEIKPASVGIGTTNIQDDDTTLYVVGNSEFYGDVSVSGTLTANNVNSLTLATAQNVSGLGTSVNFTGIPSWVKRVTVMLSEVSTNGTSNYLIRLGDSGGIENAGYISNSGTVTPSSFGAVSETTAFLLTSTTADADGAYSGLLIIANITGNTWVLSGNLGTVSGAPRTFMNAGSKTLSNTLTQLRITTVGGTDTFDGTGTINIMYE